MFEVSNTRTPMAGTPVNAELPTAGGSPRTDTLADSVMILLGLTAVQRVVGFCRAIIFCRWLDPEQLGRWEMAFSFLLLAAPLAVLALPGAFRRYVEHYRQAGQLRTFLGRTATVCSVLAAVAVASVLLGRRWFSVLIFGNTDQGQLVAILAVGLIAVVAHNFLIELFTALRNVRLVAVMQLINSVAFAALGAWLLLWWQRSAAAVVAAYGAACLIAACCAWPAVRRTWNSSYSRGVEPLAAGTLWGKIGPFAAWLLLAAVLANLFGVVDRYMLIHFSTASPDDALRQVGNYHSARVVPVLLISIAAMLGTMITPHLSRDWEAGRRNRAGLRLRLFLKLFGLAVSAAAVGLLAASPLLFGVAFKGKFAGGLAVLPWTVTYCSWFALFVVAQTYLWCAEKARLASVALAVGMVANVCLNLLLLPKLGLPGAVLATAAANLAALVLLGIFNHLLGFPTDRGLLVIGALPITVCLGPPLATLVLVGVVLEAVYRDRIFNAQEKRKIVDGTREYLLRFRKLRFGTTTDLQA